MEKVVILGCGNMGGALARGLYKVQNHKGLWLCDPHEALLSQIISECSCSGAKTLSEIPEAEVLILAVKPQIFPSMVSQIANWVKPQTLVVSIMAGVSQSHIQSLLNHKRVLRTMPNLPLSVGEGLIALATDNQRHEDICTVESIFSSVGRVQRVLESQMDAVTALSGSGPAYVFEFVRGLVMAGIHEGLSEETASGLVRQTLKGSLALLESGGSASDWTLKVCSPGGTTIHALKALEDEGFYKSLYAAVHAASQRSKALGKAN